MTDRNTDGPGTSPELRDALANLIEAIDEAGPSNDSGQLRQMATDRLDRLDRVANGVDDAEDEEDHEGPIEALRDALHRFETDHPVLTSAINNVSHYLSGLGI